MPTCTVPSMYMQADVSIGAAPPVGGEVERRTTAGHTHQPFALAPGRVSRPTTCGLPSPCERPATARWGRAHASRRPTRGADRQRDGVRCVEGHHTSCPQRVHLLGRRRQAGDHTRTPHPPDRGGAGGRPAPALLLARVQAPGADRPIAGRRRSLAMNRAKEPPPRCRSSASCARRSGRPAGTPRPLPNGHRATDFAD